MVYGGGTPWLRDLAGISASASPRGNSDGLGQNVSQLRGEKQYPVAGTQFLAARALRLAHGQSWASASSFLQSGGYDAALGLAGCVLAAYDAPFALLWMNLSR